MSEWFKVLAWKAGVGQKPTGSSNLPLSATYDLLTLILLSHFIQVAFALSLAIANTYSDL
jgi:hypothetical protein